MVSEIMSYNTAVTRDSFDIWQSYTKAKQVADWNWMYSTSRFMPCNIFFHLLHFGRIYTLEKKIFQFLSLDSDFLLKLI